MCLVNKHEYRSGRMLVLGLHFSFHPAINLGHTLPHSQILCIRKKGTSLTFVTREDWRQAHKLINIMVEANQVNRC